MTPEGGGLLRLTPARWTSDEPPYVPAQGGKNLFNHMLATMMLVGEPGVNAHFHRTPEVSDRLTVAAMLTHTGLSVSISDTEMTVQGHPTTAELPQSAGSLRVTMCHIAALACNLRTCIAPIPGGDAFTDRPIDLHLEILRRAGASWTIRDRRIKVDFPQEPHSFDISLATPSFGPSVGATVSALLVATRATDTSMLSNASIEPEVLGCIGVLRSLGARISWRTANSIEVVGLGRPLAGDVDITVPADRIEACTYMLMGLLRHSRVVVDGIAMAELPQGFLEVLDRIGIDVRPAPAREAAVQATIRGRLMPVDVITGPHPGFPTDLQPQLCAFLSQVPGCSTIVDTVYLRRVSHVEPLVKLGAQITVSEDGRQTIVGSSSLVRKDGDDPLFVPDLRCGASLMVAACAARGSIDVFDPMGHIARGYSRLAWKLSRLGIAASAVVAGPGANEHRRPGFQLGDA